MAISIKSMERILLGILGSKNGGEFMGNAGPKGRFLMVRSQKRVYRLVFPIFRAKMETCFFYLFLMATSVKKATHMDPGSGLTAPGVRLF